LLHADVVADCSQVREARLRLHACSEIIAGTEYGVAEKGTAYRNRGSARADAGAHQDVLADAVPDAGSPTTSSCFQGDCQYTGYVDYGTHRVVTYEPSTMPNLVIDSADMDNLVAYILSL